MTETQKKYINLGLHKKQLRDFNKQELELNLNCLLENYKIQKEKGEMEKINSEFCINETMKYIENYDYRNKKS